MTLKACPDCGGNLGRDAAKCRCGWKAGFSSQRQVVSCAHDGCLHNAVIKEQTPTGWANFCEHHWTRFHRERAERWCKQQGIFSLADKIAFCRKTLGNRMTAAWDREPGSDDEMPRKHFMQGVEAKAVAGD